MAFQRGLSARACAARVGAERTEGGVTVDVTYVLDRGFVRPSVLSAWSLLAARPGETVLRFLLTEPAPELDPLADRLRRRFPQARIEARHERALDHGMTTRGHVSAATLARLRLPGLLEAPTLYLDGDTMVCRDVGEMFDAPREGKPLAAVRDAGILRSRLYGARGGWVPPKARRHLRDLGRLGDMVDAARYFNAGVALFDLPRIRALGLDVPMGDIAGAVALREAHDLRFNDQNWLNHVFRGQVALLDPAWNALWGNVVTARAPFPPEMRAAFAASRDNPGIVHFTGRLRPWEVRHVWAHPRRRPWLGRYKAMQAEAEAVLWG